MKIHIIFLVSLSILLTPNGLLAEQSLSTPVGSWRWYNKVIVVIKEDGTTQRGPVKGTWAWDDQKKLSFHIQWPGNLVKLTLSEDFSKVSGINQKGIQVSGIRATTDDLQSAKDTHYFGTSSPE